MRNRMRSAYALVQALHNLNKSESSSDEYSRGLLVGVIACITSYEDCGFEDAVEIAKEFLPMYCRPESIPEPWRAWFKDRV